MVALRTTSCSHLLQQGCAFLIDDTLPPSQVASEWPPCGVTGEIAICITSETDNSFRFGRQNWIAFGFYSNQDLAPGTEAGSSKTITNLKGNWRIAVPKGKLLGLPQAGRLGSQGNVWLTLAGQPLTWAVVDLACP